MLGMGHWWIILLVLAIVLIVYGPGKLPEVGGAIGKGLREFRKASTELQDEIRRGSTAPESPPPAATPTPPAEDLRASRELPAATDPKSTPDLKA